MPNRCAAEPGAQPPEPADHLVGDQQHVVGGGTAPARDPSSRRRGWKMPPAPITGSPMKAAIWSPRSANSAASASVSCSLTHRGLGHQRAESLQVAGDPGQARAVGVHAVVGALAVHDQPLLGAADRAPVAQSQLAGRVHRVGAAAGEEDGRALHRCQARHPFCELERRPVGGAGEDVVGRQLPHLGGDRIARSRPGRGRWPSTRDRPWRRRTRGRPRPTPARRARGRAPAPRP